MFVDLKVLAGDCLSSWISWEKQIGQIESLTAQNYFCFPIGILDVFYVYYSTKSSIGTDLNIWRDI